MQVKSGIIAVAGSMVLALSACGSDTPELMHLRSNNADEFAVVPSKPLQMPQDYAALPTPTPGGSNLTDPTPEADAIAALGGNPAVLNAGGVPASDGVLVSQAGRYGTEAGIRSQLAAEDLDWRRKHNGRLLERWFSVNMYYKSYRDMSLDQDAELARWRNRGVRTVGAPPTPDELADQPK